MKSQFQKRACIYFKKARFYSVDLRLSEIIFLFSFLFAIMRAIRKHLTPSTSFFVLLSFVPIFSLISSSPFLSPLPLLRWRK